MFFIGKITFLTIAIGGAANLIIYTSEFSSPVHASPVKTGPLERPSLRMRAGSVTTLNTSLQDGGGPVGAMIIRKVILPIKNIC